MKLINKTIFGKKYKLYIANSLRDKKKGMNIFKVPPKNTGMLFNYREDLENRKFSLAKTPFGLIVIFINAKGEIVHLEKGKAYQTKLIHCNKPSSIVIEIPD